MRAVLPIPLLAALVTPAAAQPALTPPSPPPSPPPAFRYEPAPRPAEYKSPGTATLLALGASAAGVGGLVLGYRMRDGGDTPTMMLGGLVAVFGPSFGHWWVDGTPTFTAGFAIRLAGAAIAGIGYGRAVDTGCRDRTCDAPLENTHSNALLGIGVATVVGGMAYDIATAGRAAERHNAALGVAPTVLTTPSGTAAGLGLSGRF